jgi:pimeloyl-ACP methyl ester carboxylesterase
MPQDKFIQAQGLRIRYFEEGAGPAVLLLHGASLGSSADVWTENLAALAAYGLRVVAFDQPGFGLSAPPEDHSVAFRTRFVTAFMDAMRLQRAHLIGHSQSGRIAVSLALAQPQRVARIVVLGTGSLLPPLSAGESSDAGEGEEGGTAEPTLEETRKSLENNLFNPALITSAALQTRHRMSTGQNFRAFLARRQARAGEKKKAPVLLWQRLAEVPVPMRLIYGRQDRGAAAERAALAKQRYPDLDLHLLDRCKHLIQWDAAAEFAALSGRCLAD